MAIRSFKDPIAEAVFNSQRPKSFPSDLAKVTRRKLVYLDAAVRWTISVRRQPIALKR